MGRHQELVAACKQDRSRCPELPREPPAPGSVALAGHLPAPHPRLPEASASSTPSSTSTPSRCATRDASTRRWPASSACCASTRARASAPTPGWPWPSTASTSSRTSPARPARLRAGAEVSRARRCTAWRCSRPPGAPGSWGTPTRRPPASRRCSTWARRPRSGSAEEQKRAAELSDQALEYLVELFTEDDSKTAEDAYDFLAQIGGKAYSQRVMRRFADTVFDQTRYERAAEAYQFLICLDRKSPDAPEFQQRVVESYQALGEGDRAGGEMRKLASDYGPKSEWAKANARSPQAGGRGPHARPRASSAPRPRPLHAQAQRNEKESRVVDKRAVRARRPRPTRSTWSSSPTPTDAAELRYLRADILYFKLGDYAGRRAASTWRWAEPSRWAPTTRTPCCNAMNAFEKLRQPAAAGRGPRASARSPTTIAASPRPPTSTRRCSPRTRRSSPSSTRTVSSSTTTGDYDEAIKRFGLIIEQHPDSPTAAAAGDRAAGVPGRGQGLRQHRALVAPPEEDPGLRRPQASRTAWTG